MELVKILLYHIYKREYFWLGVMVIATLIMHFSIINEIKVPILDEVYYAGYYPEQQGNLHYGDAYNILTLHNDARPEHPPLAKLFIASGIVVVGDNNVGWRVPSIIFGTISIILVFYICRSLGMSLRASNLATFLFSFENFGFMLASIAMLDVFLLTMTLAFFLLYLNRKYIASGIFIGLAALTKLLAAMGAPTIFFHWLFSRVNRSWKFVFTAILAPISFVALFPVFDFIINRNWENPLARIKEMLSLTGSLTFANTTHPALSRPWEWLLNYNPMAFWYTPHYTGAVAPLLWGLMIPIVLYMLYLAIKRRDEAGLFGFSWFAGMFLLLIPLSAITNRVSFIFYFYPAIGALCLGLGLAFDHILNWVSSRRLRIKIPVVSGIVVLLLFHVASFVVLSPVFFRT